MDNVTDSPPVAPILAEEAPLPSGEKPDQRPSRRPALWLVLGGSVGLVLGILLTLGVFATHRLVTDTIPSTTESVRVFNELNDLRQQVNQINEARKLKEQELAAVRQAVSTVTLPVRAPESEMPGAAPSAKKPSGSANAPSVGKPQGPLAEVDDAIEQLEQTQKVLNTILDLFARNNDKARAKDR